MPPAIKFTLGLFVNCYQFAWLPIACTVSHYTDQLTLETLPAQLTHTQTLHHTTILYHSMQKGAVQHTYLIDSCLCSRDSKDAFGLDSFCVQIVNGLSHYIRHLWVGGTEGHSSLGLGGWGQGVQHLEKGRCRVGLNVQVIRCVRASASR